MGRVVQGLILDPVPVHFLHILLGNYLVLLDGKAVYFRPFDIFANDKNSISRLYISRISV